ncbi:MAG TPA: aldolase/citrate lyase family protein [Acetobacteraceae bacterium]|nr:aldolase/citrate lyase family protein [Acetobacteraceae bacterium]
MSASATLPPNALKAALREQRTQIGLWSSLGSNIVAELLAYAGYDWIVVDTEHAPSDPVEVLAQLQGLATGTAEPVVRVAWNDAVLMKRLLDIGARSLLVPFVQSAAEAKAAVAATRYPPHGIRGVSVAHRANRFGRLPGYLQTAHTEICVLVQLETRVALAALEGIAAVDGVDGLFIGPSDLAADLGHLGNAAHPDVQAAIADACSRIRAAGKPAGILAPVEADARRYFEMGFSYVAIGSDVGILATGSTNLVARMREAIGEPPIRVAG